MYGYIWYSDASKSMWERIHSKHSKEMETGLTFDLKCVCVAAAVRKAMAAVLRCVSSEMRCVPTARRVDGRGQSADTHTFSSACSQRSPSPELRVSANTTEEHTHTGH